MEHHTRQSTVNKGSWERPGLDLISFYTEQERDGEMEKVRGETLRLCPVRDTRTLEGPGGIMTVNLSVLVSASTEKMDYTSSCLFE